MVNYYEVLGVETDASNDQLKIGYKKKALEWHPDKVEQNKRAEAIAKFQLISEAYQTLINRRKRETYDRDNNIQKRVSAVALSTPQQNERILSPNDLFVSEFTDIFAKVQENLEKQPGGVLKLKVGRSVLGAAAFGAGAAMFFPPFVIPAVVAGGIWGWMDRNAPKDIASLYVHMNPEAKKHILELATLVFNLTIDVGNDFNQRKG